MKTGMKAIIKKDMHTITKNKRMFSTLFIVPLVLTVFLPTVMLLAVFFAPSEASDFEKLLQLLPFQYQGENFSLAVIDAIFNYILPIFFLIIPIMVASIMAATSFTGEKEKHTLETLLYCPLSLKEIFRAKVLASFILSMLVSLISFAIMLIVLETEMFFIADHLLIPDFNWLIILLVVSPAISMIAITLIVRVSVKSQSVEDAQQRAAFLVLPIVLLIVGQLAGVLLIDLWILLILGCVFAVIALILLKKAMGKFSYERFLQ